MNTPAIRDYIRAAAVGGDVSDAALLERFAAARDEAAFELLVWRHAALVQRVCKGVLHDHHAAEDAAQATFLVLARKSGSVRGSVVGWLYRVARRVAVRLAKQRARSPVSAELDRVPATLAESAAPDELAAVCDAVAALPERYRVPVLLCFFEGLTHAEAARRIGWPVGTVAGRLARAKDILARRLARKGVGVAAVVLGVPAGSFVGATAHAATVFAARAAVVPCVERSVFSLAEGACRTMTMTITKCAALVAGLFLATASVWGVAQTGGTPQPPAAVKPAVAVPLAAGDRVADAKQRLRSINNLKQILLAVHNHHDTLDYLPRDSADKNGKPLLSWRVMLLPFIDGNDDLYKKFKFDEPWDSEANKKLLPLMPEVYRVGFETKGETKTYYQGYAGTGTVFEPGDKLKMISVTDGTSNTLCVVEAGPPVEWTKPADIPFDPKKPLAKRDGPFKNVFHVAALDGAAYIFRPDVADDTLRILIGRNDGIPGPVLKSLTAKMPLTREEMKEAHQLLAASAKLTESIGEQVREQQRLLTELGKLQDPKNPVSVVDLQRLAAFHKELEFTLEIHKRETAELEKEVKALKKK